MSSNITLESCSNNSVCNGGTSDIHAQNCQDLIYNSCAGNSQEQSWISNWWVKLNGNQTCAKAVSIYLRSFANSNQCYVTEYINGEQCTGTNDSNPINSEMWNWAQNIVEEAVSNYHKLGYNIGVMKGSYGYTPFNDVIIKDVCCQNPGLCNNFLNEYCIDFSIDTISKSDQLRRMCSCHMNSLNYQQYSVNYNIEQQCSTLCNTSTSIPLTSTAGDVVDCKQNICIIDGTSLTLFDDIIDGNIKFEQICGNSEPGTVSCSISNDVIEIINSDIGGDLIPILNQCGSITCDKNGTSAYCSTNEIINFKKSEKVEKNNLIIRGGIMTLLIVSIIFVLVIILIIIYKKDDIFSKKGKRSNNK